MRKGNFVSGMMRDMQIFPSFFWDRNLIGMEKGVGDLYGVVE